jgi:hypothetical protein
MFITYIQCCKLSSRDISEGPDCQALALLISYISVTLVESNKYEYICTILFLFAMYTICLKLDLPYHR